MNDIFQNAIIVAAHPDDEILWFSSIIEKVKQVVICYVLQESKPEWTAGRVQALSKYPLGNMHTLNFHLSDVFNCGDWKYPLSTPYGIHLSRNGCHRDLYESNYLKLKNEFKVMLRPYQHVFTHNPWGEYGHEEHVQLFRVIQELQSQLGFTLWVSNYVSNHSIYLYLESVRMMDEYFFRLPTNKKRAAQIRDLYKECGCWTWYPDFQWCDEDVFLRIDLSQSNKRRIGKSYPLNFIDVDEVGTPNLFIKKTDRIVQLMCRFRNRYFSPKK
ncbi:MAG: GlcNAc-PI de-N-acetylase [Pseudomonadota bacterium]